MALFDIFKKIRKNRWEGDRYREKSREKARTSKETHQVQEKAEQEKAVQTSFASNLASSVLRAPVITERSTALAEQGAYVFHVRGNAAKPQIKRAVEELYHTKVTRVRISNTKPKRRRMRGVVGVKPGYKKAIVTLEEGKKIEFV